MNKEQLQELHISTQNGKAAAQKRIDYLMYEDLLDEDGYPTEAALEIVRIWHWSDSPGWFEFIKSIWHLAPWGWSEKESIEVMMKNDYHGKWLGEKVKEHLGVEA